MSQDNHYGGSKIQTRARGSVKCEEPCSVDIRVRFIHIYTYVHIYTGFPGGSEVRNLPAKAGDADSIHRLGSSLGEGNDNLLQYSCVGNPMDRGASWITVHGVAKNQAQLSD